MGILLVGLVLLFSSTLSAQDGIPRQIAVYIQDNPPIGYSHKEWYDACFHACEEWYLKVGCGVYTTRDYSKADVAFMLADLTVRNIYGQCGIVESWPVIPHKFKIVIHINIYIQRMPYSNLQRTLLHEVGHSVGFKHEVGSLVNDGNIRPTSLTDQDKTKLKQLKVWVDRTYPLKLESPAAFLNL